MAALLGSRVGGAMLADVGPLVARLDEPLLQLVLGSLQAQLSSLEDRVDSERQQNVAQQAQMHAQITALQTDNGAKQAHIDSIVTSVEHHALKIERCANTSEGDRGGGPCSRRNMQSQGPASQGDVVRLFRRDADVLHPSANGGGTATGGGGHRR